MEGCLYGNLTEVRLQRRFLTLRKTQMMLICVEWENQSANLMSI